MSSRVQTRFNRALKIVQRQHPGFQARLKVHRTNDPKFFPKKRNFAYTVCDVPHVMGVSPRLEKASIDRIDAILMHEFGHLFIMGGPKGLDGGPYNLDHSERDADKAAEKLFGISIGYDQDDVQTLGPGIRPRPARLDKPEVRKNPPEKEQLRRVARAVYESLREKGAASGRSTLSKAYAIATKQLQKSGYLIEGTAVPTQKGRIRSRVKLAEPDAASKKHSMDVILGIARRNPGEPDWLAPDQIEPWIPLARKWGVSTVALSPRGFYPAFKRVRGDFRELGVDPYSGQSWRDRRNNFVARHMAQVRAKGEPLWKDGLPTRRHLALIMWAFTPDPEKLDAAV